MDMFKAISEWEGYVSDWLDKQEQADILREAKNDRLAEVVTKQNGGSHAERDRQARISNEWKDFRTGMVEAENIARRAKFRMKRAEYMIQAVQDANASQRKEMKMGGAVT